MSSQAPPPPPATLSAAQIPKWELGVALLLNFWPPLTDAVGCQWGGADSSDKRDWLCGAIADLWETVPDADEFEVESTLVQVMEDEFDVALEDDSAYEVRRSREGSALLTGEQVAKKVVELRRRVAEDDFTAVDTLHQRFLAMPQGQRIRPPTVEAVDQDAGSSEDEDEDEDEEMGDAPAAAAPRQKEKDEPEIDEDGFETVRRRKR